MKTMEVVETFLGHVFSGRTEQAISLVHPEARFVGTRPVSAPDNPLMGTFRGSRGAAQFFARFAEVLEPGEFNVEGRFSDGDHAALYGTLRHRVRRTGRDFVSDWALVCQVRDQQVLLYHFYEDTAALAEAGR